MSTHVCEAIVITCIDFRFITPVRKWAKEHFGKNNYDRVSIAGGIMDFYTVLRQVEISNKLHKIKKVIMINHEDCGAYGKDGTFEKHEQDLDEAERKIEALFPHLDVETYYLKLDGTFIETSKTRKIPLI